MSASLHERARRVRARAAVRAWEYRQREHARGVWYRLRRTLAGARAAYAIDEADAAALLAEGARPLAVGAELAPEKIILLVGEEQIGRASCREECRSRWSPYH